jgi:hypothetical protein
MASVQELITYISNHSSVALSCVIVVLVIYILYLDHKIVAFTRGSHGASLEDIIKSCLTSVAAIEKKNELISKQSEILHDRISHAIRNAQTIRYKAFEVNGSNQSFSIALVNERGNGVVISSLHSHDRIRTFAKPIENYESTYELTEEELAVLDDAKASHQYMTVTL